MSNPLVNLFQPLIDKLSKCTLLSILKNHSSYPSRSHTPFISKSKMSLPDRKVQQYITERQQSFTDGFNNASVPALMAMFAEDVEFNDYGISLLSLSLQVHTDIPSYGRAQPKPHFP